MSPKISATVEFEKGMEITRLMREDKAMTDTELATAIPLPIDQQGLNELRLRIGQLEAETGALEQENKTLRLLLERVIDHRQKSHSELVLLLTSLVSKLPINDVGVIVSRLVEHNTNVAQTLAGLVKGTADAHLPQPTVLKTLEQTKHELMGALKPVIEELVQLETPIETGLLESLAAQPELFFSPRMVRANRCFIKGQVPRERVLREFGDPALKLFNDLTTDPKLNPRPKPEEIALGFKSDFETLLGQDQTLTPQKKEGLLGLAQRIQRSKASSGQAQVQRNAFQKMSFLLELIHYYDNQNTEAPDVLFAQRLPALVEQLVIAGSPDQLDEKLIDQAERLMSHIINPDHRQMVINNLGKGGGMAKTLKYVLRLRSEKVPEMDQVIAEFFKHLLPTRQKPPAAQTLAAIFRLLHPALQPVVIRSLMRSDRLRKEDAETLGRAIATQLGIPNIDAALKSEALSPEMDRQIAWGKIKDLISRRADAATVASAIRDRLHAKYDADEIRQSWITLTEADPISLIRIFCQLPYLANGSTDAIASTVLQTYVTRLTHEKYAVAYNKVIKSLRNVFHAKADSPTLLNFLALVRWVSPEAALRMATDIGMPVPA
jgi:hypothetical protein